MERHRDGYNSICPCARVIINLSPGLPAFGGGLAKLVTSLVPSANLVSIGFYMDG